MKCLGAVSDEYVGNNAVIGFDSASTFSNITEIF